MDELGVTLYSKDMQPFVEQVHRETCFFHGSIPHQKNSFAVVDACQTPSIKVFMSLNGRVLQLEPGEDEDGHILRSFSSQSSLATFFTSNAISKRQLAEEIDESELLGNRARRQTEPGSGPLFLELYIVCDNALFREFNGDTGALEEKVGMLVEILKEMYLDLGVYIHLTGIEIWNEGDLISPVNSGLRTMLDDFLLWRQEDLLRRHPHDFAIILSGRGYSRGSSSPPLVFKSEICSNSHSGLAIKELNLNDPVLPSLLARNIGFAMGISRDDVNRCECPEPNGCIMGNKYKQWIHGPPTSFSPCSKESLQTSIRRRIVSCLIDQPAGFIFPPRCGDGNLDDGEECDCGSEEECRDICCSPLNCTLDKVRAECQPSSLPPSTTSSPPDYDTTYIEDFVTEFETEPYDLTTFFDEEAAQVTSSSYLTSQMAATERPLTENERLISQIKELLGAASIQAPPSLIQGPGDSLQYFIAAANVTLTCQVSGVPKPNVTWFRDGLELTQDDGALGFTEEDGSLSIISVTQSDAGDYHCQAENSHGLIISDKTTLSIAYFDEVSLMGPLEIYHLDERDSKVLECQVPDGNPTPDIFWTKNLDTKQPLTLDGRVTQTPSGHLVIGSASTEDNGDYACIVTNPVTREVRVGQSIIVKVNALAYEPFWEYTSPPVMTSLMGTPLSLHCIPSGSPTPEVKWEKLSMDGESDMADLMGYGHSLTIQSPDVNDSGLYRCTGSNGVGNSPQAIFNVSVEGAPGWITKPENVEITAGSSHSFTCEASGHPLPSISWFVNGQPAEEAVLKYPHLSYSSVAGSGIFNISEEEGIYLTVVLQCIAENQHGRLLANAYANIIALPAKITSLLPESVSVLEGEDIRIPCQSIGAPQPEIFWQVGVKVLAAEEDGSLFIPSAGVGDANSYYCRVRNKFGFEDKKVLVHVRGLTQVTLSSNDVSAEEESELILTCQVDHYADNPPDVEWSRAEGTPLDSNRTLIEFNDEASMSTLFIERLTVADSGFYVCTATTEYDQAADQAYITVSEKVIIQPPVAPGNITIVTQTHFGLLLMWEHEYSINAPVSSFSIEARNNYNPDQWEVIKEVTGEREDAVIKVNPYVTYWFRVTAKNDVGQATSPRTGPFPLPPSTPLVNPQNVAVNVSDPGYIVVSWDEMPPLEHAGPKFFYRLKWRRLGSKRWKDVKIRDHAETEYTFEMDRGDSTGLQVAVKSGNLIGNGPRAEFITALFKTSTTTLPPTTTPAWVVEHPIYKRVLEGSLYELNCSLSEQSNPSTSWFKGGLLLENTMANYTIEDEGSLLFPSFSDEDAGQYQCTMQSSSGGYIRATHNLIIRRRTVVSTDPSEVEAVLYSFVEVFCNVKLDPSILSADILWVDSNNERIPYYYDAIDARVYRNDSTLIIEELLHSDAGNYTCIAQTLEDYAEATVSLTVEALKLPSVSPGPLVVQLQDSETITVSWGSVTEEDAGGPVVGYNAVARLRGDVQGDSKECFTIATFCTLTGLTPSSDYEVFVAVRTSAGQGPFSAAVYVTLDDPEPIKPGPVTIEKTRVWAKTLTVRWLAPEEGDPLYGYILSYGPETSGTLKERTLAPSTTSHKISGLTPLTRYVISIEAYNRAGRGERNTQIVTTTQKKKE
ncbi:uncharacterized protein [Apostichopus japonicus]